jgi:predicted deacylase
MFGASMVQTSSRITSTIDFDREGRQSTCLRAPLSRNLSAWGTIEIPIFVVKNGKGPTVLFTGGIHGDEYEGPIAISRLAQMLDPSEIKGRVIMMPAVNIPAVLNDTRLSPVDQRDISPGTRHMMVRDPSCYVFAPSSGLFEPYHLAGAEVVEGESAGQLHFVEEVDRRSLDLRYKRSGTIWMAAGPGRVQRGDVVAVTMSEYDETDWALP